MDTATVTGRGPTGEVGAPVEERIAVIGLGYVGLPVALAFGSRYGKTVGFDVDDVKVARLLEGRDHTGEASPDDIAAGSVRFTADEKDLKGATFFVVAVPTPITADRRPDLRYLLAASEIVGRALTAGSVVVYESTVYPGVTEDICGPVLERISGLRRGVDFTLGYSPERINPGDKDHTLPRVTKVVAGEDPATLDRVARVYEGIVDAGVYRAKSIKVAEAAKVIENTQRDLNIALMNELAMIFDRLEINTIDVLEAAGTKWNFLPFRPGLVGGHCIGVDPYYLTAKAEEVGYHPHVILAGRRINDGIGSFVANKVLRMLADSDKPLKHNRVGVLGLTFKENVPDLRNSRVPDIVRELTSYGLDVRVHDPMADADEALHEYGIKLRPLSDLEGSDAVVLAVPHRQLLVDAKRITELVSPGGALVDVKAALKGTEPTGLRYWSL